MNYEYRRRMRLILAVTGIAAIVAMIVQFVSVTSFNSKLRTVDGADSDKPSYIEILKRGGTTSSWYKKDLKVYGVIYDGTLYNNSPDQISSWELKINIEEDCCINQFWNGTVEIHQHVSTGNERVQTLNLADCKAEELNLDYIVDGADILFPLSKGDYVIYYPSKTVKETPVPAGSSVTIGVIFYSEKPLDITDYSMEYYYHKGYTHGWGFIVACVLTLGWVFVFGIFSATLSAYRRAEKEMELRKSGISCMSDMYEAIYIADISNDLLTKVSADEETEKSFQKNTGAAALLTDFFETDSEGEYKDAMLEFADLSTIPERLEGKESIAIEYLSKNRGWCRIHFIAMDRKPDKPVDRVLFTIEEINEEKEEYDRVLGQVEKVRSESKAKSAFLENVSYEILTPVNIIDEQSRKILNDASSKDIKDSAVMIMNAGEALKSQIDVVLDFSKLEAGTLKLEKKGYSLRELIKGIEESYKKFTDDKGISLVKDVTESLPDRLLGDPYRIGQIISVIMDNSLSHTEKGSIKLSVFGKVVDEKSVHLLVSVKDTGVSNANVSTALLKEGEKEDPDEGGLSMKLICRLLELMGSELKVTYMNEFGNDYYFEFDQEIAG
ncbi:MAG: hypothetical protein K6G22_11510 [Lachnospiraceae bacterium]|nr:hypothetical protein [Lachnospiraceae bacterium]